MTSPMMRSFLQKSPKDSAFTMTVAGIQRQKSLSQEQQDVLRTQLSARFQMSTSNAGMMPSFNNQEYNTESFGIAPKAQRSANNISLNDILMKKSQEQSFREQQQNNSQKLVQPAVIHSISGTGGTPNVITDEAISGQRRSNNDNKSAFAS